jgi:hypothetical protein
MLNKKLIGAALAAGLFAGAHALAENKPKTDAKAKTADAKEKKNGCGGKDGCKCDTKDKDGKRACKGKDKDSCKGKSKSKEKNACGGPDGCGGADGCGGKK